MQTFTKPDGKGAGHNGLVFQLNVTFMDFCLFDWLKRGGAEQIKTTADLYLQLASHELLALTHWANVAVWTSLLLHFLNFSKTLVRHFLFATYFGKSNKIVTRKSDHHMSTSFCHSNPLHSCFVLFCWSSWITVGLTWYWIACQHWSLVNASSGIQN